MAFGVVYSGLNLPITNNNIESKKREDGVRFHMKKEGKEKRESGPHVITYSSGLEV